MKRKAKATYRFRKGGLFARAMNVEADGPPVRGLVVNVYPSWNTRQPPTERKRWNITHARSGIFLLSRLDRKTALAVRNKLAELADWDLPASAFRGRNLERKGTIRHRDICQLARANPREFAVNGGGMDKA